MLLIWVTEVLNNISTGAPNLIGTILPPLPMDANTKTGSLITLSNIKVLLDFTKFAIDLVFGIP